MLNQLSVLKKTDFYNHNVQHSSCSCDGGWQGTDCKYPIKPLPQQIRESFSQQPAVSGRGVWLNINGGMVSSTGGPVASGKALHFIGVSFQNTDNHVEIFFFIESLLFV